MFFESNISCDCILPCKYCGNGTIKNSYYGMSEIHRQCKRCRVYFGCIHADYTGNKTNFIELYIRKINNKIYELKINLNQNSCRLTCASHQYKEIKHSLKVNPNNIIEKIKLLLIFE